MLIEWGIQLVACANATTKSRGLEHYLSAHVHDWRRRQAESTVVSEYNAALTYANAESHGAAVNSFNCSSSASATISLARCSRTASASRACLHFPAS